MKIYNIITPLYTFSAVARIDNREFVVFDFNNSIDCLY
jgi:hypothetical protein